MKNHFTRSACTIAISALALTVGSAAAQQQQNKAPSIQEQTARLFSEDQAESVIGEWEEAPAQAARRLIESYGVPQEITKNRLIWHNNGPWERTEIVNEEVEHNFPEPHTDFLYQTVNFNVPEEKVADIVGMSGSILIDRVKGEVTARCDSEEANFVALNLMNQIVDGRKDARSGRDTYAQTMLEGKHQDLAERLHFTSAQVEDPGDPGVVYGARETDTEVKKQEEQPEAKEENRKSRRQQILERMRNQRTERDGQESQ